MEILYYVFWLIIGPVFAGFLAVTIFRKVYKIIYIIEGMIILFFTYIDIIQNHPYGNMVQQLSSYFSNITNNFYTTYLPFLLITIIAIKIYFKNKKRTTISKFSNIYPNVDNVSRK